MIMSGLAPSMVAMSCTPRVCLLTSVHYVTLITEYNIICNIQHTLCSVLLLYTLSCSNFTNRLKHIHAHTTLHTLVHIIQYYTPILPYTHLHSLYRAKKLNLQGLRNLSIDQSLLNGSTKAIISYLKSRLTRSVPYYHMKMMIVGAADKGKTTLLQAILQEKMSSSLKTNVATMGVTVKPWSYLQKQMSGHSDKYHISCWDFAGQEEFYTTHQCFLSQRSLYVVSSCALTVR